MTDASKKARRDQAREHAREMREKERKRKTRNGWIIKGSVVLVAIAAAVVTVLVVTSIRQAEEEAARPKPGPANMISDGIILTADSAATGEIVAVPTAAIAAGEEPTPTNPADYPDKVRIVTYLDYFCPFCQAFDQTNSQQMGSWVAAGAATLEIHPIAILDRASLGTRYSTRSANAMACVANFEPDLFFQATTVMFTAQPAESTEGLTDSQIIVALSQAGVTAPEVPDCVKNETFSQWVTKATLRTNDPIPNSNLARVEATPTVLVNGILYEGPPNDAAVFEAFVSAIATNTYVPPAD